MNDLQRSIKGLYGSFITLAAFSGFLNLLMLAPSIYMLQVYDRVLSSRNETTLIVLTFLLIGVYVFSGLLETVRSAILVRVGVKFDSELNDRVFSTAFNLSLNKPRANAAQPVQDVGAVRQSLSGAAILTLFDAPWLPIYLVVIFLFSWELGVFALTGAFILTALAIFNESFTKNSIEEAQKYSVLSQQALSNNLRNAEVIEAMGMLPAIRRRWQVLHQKQLALQASASDRAAVMSGISKFIRITMQSLSLGIGALMVLESKMSPGAMIAASVLTSRALAPVELLVANWKQIVSGRAAYKRLKQLFESSPAKEYGMSLQPPNGNVRFEGVSAVAPDTKNVIIKGVGFAINAGECIAVIGPSGSGKSTLARLLVGVWPAVAGVIRLDGADLYQWDKEKLGPHIGYLPQDIELFDGTVAENIARFGEIDSEKVIAAATKVGMHEVILRLPNGYETQLGVSGGALSGGQRQRIGLARAIYGDPVLLVFDEPNSNLDEQGEFALQATIRDLGSRGKTVVLITHKISLLAVVQRIMILGDGVIKAFGPRDDVLTAIRTKVLEHGSSRT